MEYKNNKTFNPAWYSYSLNDCSGCKKECYVGKIDCSESKNNTSGGGGCDCCCYDLSRSVVGCRTCPNSVIENGGLKSVYHEITQKRIQNQVRAPASLFTMNLGAVTVGKQYTEAPSNKGVGVKHDSYARYLAKKKTKHLLTDNKLQPSLINTNSPKYGKYGMLSGCFRCSK